MSNQRAQANATVRTPSANVRMPIARLVVLSVERLARTDRCGNGVLEKAEVGRVRA
jgi:hypothetical protein